MGETVTLAAMKSITLPGSDEFLGWSEWNSGVSDLGGSGSLGRPRTNRPTLALHSLDWAPGPSRQKSMGIEGWKEILEFAVGNPVLVGYLAYIVGLLIAVAVVKATETGEGPIGRSHS